jgi:putative addiction module CopG family antidote
MVTVFPPDITQFIQEEVAAGHYSSEQEVVQEAVRFFRESRDKYSQLREEVRQRIAGLDAGLGIEIEDDEHLASFFDEIEAEVRREAGE